VPSPSRFWNLKRNHLCGRFGFGCLDPFQQLLPGKHPRLAILQGGEFLVVGFTVLRPQRGFFRFGSEGQYSACFAFLSLSLRIPAM
jgi:hypothetical protein